VRRREFIKLAGGVAAWPLTARAQERERLRRIAWLVGTAKDVPGARDRDTAFLEAFEQLGWTNGRNVQIDIRWAAGNADDIRKYAVELVALAPDVILATGGAGAAVMLKATQTIPIVFAVVPDPTAPASSRVSRDRAATLPASCRLSTACVESGQNCSRRLRQT